MLLKPFNELTLQQLYDILKLRNEVFIVEQNCPYQDIDNKDQQSLHLMHYEGEKLMAYLRIIRYPSDAIGRVIVHQDKRGKGLARKIMLEAMKFFKQESVTNDNPKVIKLQAQTYLLDFYKSLGFVPVSEVYLEDNIPHVDMEYKY
ncbi:MAG: GNAT family N-acetyltransferase [Candidatus Cyclobacteriaceae bacterium M2_1C_046]